MHQLRWRAAAMTSKVNPVTNLRRWFDGRMRKYAKRKSGYEEVAERAKKKQKKREEGSREVPLLQGFSGKIAWHRTCK
jgi:uncharacterized protein YeaO (DUF488 family)